MKQQQVAKQSGETFHVSLDGTSAKCMQQCIERHKQHDNLFSNSIIIRRALRFYAHYFSKLNEREDLQYETVETFRAAKGAY